MAQLGRALPWGGRGRRFKSGRSDQGHYTSVFEQFYWTDQNLEFFNVYKNLFMSFKKFLFISIKTILKTSIFLHIAYQCGDYLKSIVTYIMFNGYGLLAIILTSIVALFANDSGIVAAATMLIYAVAPLLYLGGLLYNSEKKRKNCTIILKFIDSSI